MTRTAVRYPGSAEARKRGKNRNADLLRDVIGDMITTGDPAQPGPAVPDYHRPDLLQEGFDRVRLAAGRQCGQTAKTAPFPPI